MIYFCNNIAIYQFMKKFLLSAFMLFMALAIQAVPARRVWRSFTQSDGTSVQLMLVGDEHMHYFVTKDNKAVVEDNGSYYYAVPTTYGVKSTDVLVHEVGSRSAAEESSLQAMGDQSASLKKAMTLARTQVLPNKVGKRNGNLTGSRKCLVILASFSDLDFVETDPKQAFYDMANKEGYNVNGAVGSVHDYFTACSRGQFDLTFDVVGPYKAPQTMAYYGRNSSTRNDVNVRELIQFAVKSAENDADFTQYDWDGDGEVDQVYVVYAGYGEASGASSNTIWPHESQLGHNGWYDNRVLVDGKYVNTYSCGSELSGTSGTVMDGISTMCHEFSHCMGLPDFYDTTANSGNTSANYAMDMWDLMAAGTSAANGIIPPLYTGYERNFCGWLDYRVLDPSSPCKVTSLKSLGYGGDVYQIKNPGNENEYYLLENRNGYDKWDTWLSSSYMGSTFCGLLITHVTFDQSRWSNNTVNKTGEAYQCMTIFHCDNSEATTTYKNGTYYINEAEYRGDMYPYSGKNYFDDTATPADALNTANTDGSYLMHTQLSSISTRNRFVDFRFMGGTTAWPGTVSGISDVNADSQTVNGKVYNVNGQFVGMSMDGLQKGIYITNGKKVIVK
jgi:immune inhibitor A